MAENDKSEKFFDEDKNQKLFLEGQLSLEALGFGCEHCYEAARFGMARITQLVEAGADDAMIEAELRVTDPMVKLYLFVGVQHAAYRVFFGIKEMWRLHRDTIRHISLFGMRLPEGMEQDNWAYETLYTPVSMRFEEVFGRIFGEYQRRHEGLHDGEGNLVPWNYPDLNLPTPVEEPTEVIALTDEQAERVAKLLNW